MSWLTKPKTVASQYRGDHGNVPESLRAMKVPNITLIKGLWLDIPAPATPPNYATYIDNLRIRSDTLVLDHGYTVMSTCSDTAENQCVGLIAYYRDDGVNKLLAFGANHAFAYNSSTGNLDILRYVISSPGTVAVSVADPAIVTGTLTTFQTSGVEAGDFFKISADPDANYVEIATVDSETQLTLVAVYPGAPIGAGTAYKVDRLQHGTQSQLFRSVVLEGKAVWSQGVDTLRTYNGTVVAELSSIYAAFHLTSHESRLILAHTTESGTIHPRRLRWTVIGDMSDFSGLGSGFVDLVDTPDFIMGIEDLQGQLVIYKERNIYLAQNTGNVFLPFAFSQKIQGIGIFAPNSLANDGERHFFVGNDDIYSFDTVTLRSLTQPFGQPQVFGKTTASRIRRSFFETINSDAVDNIFGFVDKRNKEYVLFTPTQGSTFPNLVWRYNYEEDTWSTTSYHVRQVSPRCIVEWKNTTFTAIDDVSNAIDDVLLPIDSFLNQENERLYIRGCGRNAATPFDLRLQTEGDDAFTSYNLGNIALPMSHLGTPGTWKTLSQVRIRYKTLVDSLTLTMTALSNTGSSQQVNKALANTIGQWDNIFFNFWLHCESVRFSLVVPRWCELGPELEIEVISRGDEQEVG